MINNIFKGGLIIIASVFIVGCGSTPSSVYPLPDSVEQFSENGSSDAINFQTTFSTDEVITFYRSALGERGLTERELLFVNENGVISMVFDGDESGQAIVVQGVTLPTDMVNINIRKEAL